MSLLDRLRYSDLGTYWTGGSESEGGHWAERWWAPSRLWREKWCFVGLHGWCLMGPEGGRDYWYVGLFWRGPKWYGGDDWMRFCAKCGVYRGATKYKRLPSVAYTCCPECGIAASYALMNGGKHAPSCSRAPVSAPAVAVPEGDASEGSARG